MSQADKRNLFKSFMCVCFSATVMMGNISSPLGNEIAQNYDNGSNSTAEPEPGGKLWMAFLSNYLVVALKRSPGRSLSDMFDKFNKSSAVMAIHSAQRRSI